MEFLTASTWSPYAVGVGIGLLSCLAFVLSDKALGCSTAFSRSAGMVERLINRKERPYYNKFPPVIEWEWMVVIGIFIGAFISSYLSDSLQIIWVPDLWEEAFGDSLAPRLFAALLGGILVGFGSRWAGGCTSGHGISGTLQLALSGYVAVACFLGIGMLTATLIYGMWF